MDIPVNYIPRDYQMPFLKAMDTGTRKAVCVWHRRSGKTKTLLNFTIKKSFERVGVYYHCFPEYQQGRKTIWDGIDKEGNKFLDHHIPETIRKSTNKTEMKIELINGSLYQIIGADNYDSLVGPNPVGMIMDEYAVSEKYKFAWDYFRPILTENKGWVVFPFTPRGRNHGWEIYQMALKNPKWFCQLLNVDNTKAIGREEIEEERLSGMSEDMIQQEYYCDFITSMGDIVIPFKYIQDSLTREVDYIHSGRIAGLDVARFGNDRSAIIIRQGGDIVYIDAWQGHDTVQTVGKVTELYNSLMFDCIAIDTIGVGAGVYDMIKNAGKIPCVAVNVAEVPTDTKFKRLRDELWWKAREWFADGNCCINKGISDKHKQDFIADIQDIRFSYSPTGQIVIETKKEMKERIKFSPDIGDAFCCTFAPGIEYKLRDIDRIPMANVMAMKNPQYGYNPLTYGLGAQ